MSLYDDLIATLPELSAKDFASETGTILLQDDADGKGVYIAKWEYDKPIPEGLTLGKPQ